MTAYCVIADVQKMLPDDALIRLTDDENVETMDTTRLQESIDSAGEEIDAYIGGVCDLPISGTVPSILGKLNVDIAIYNLYSRLQEIIPDTRQKRYDNALKVLSQIAAGKVSFGLTPPPAASETTKGAVASYRDKIFTSDKMDQY